MTDPIEAAASEIAEDSKDENSYPDGMFSSDYIADILRRHFPSWKDRPDQPGWWLWVTVLSSGELKTGPGLSGFCKADPSYETGPFTRWYGPIPDRGE